jgi:WD40 repeat protein
MSTCVRKPWLATCGTDKSVRIWNFNNGSCEIAKSFIEDPLSLSLHPTGHYLIVGFTDKLRILDIVKDDFHVYREIPMRGCREVSSRST